MKIAGRSLELFFIDGDPVGMLTAEIFNWTGHVLLAPRTRIREALDRPEVKYTGVYLLLGEMNNRSRIYIGEAEDISHRIRSHDIQKDWWDRAVLIVSSANNLHKAHIKYLESRLVEEAKLIGNVDLDNSNTPQRTSLSEAAISSMETFIENILLVIPAVRIDVFVQRKRQTIQVIEAQIPGDPEFELIARKHEFSAYAKLSGGEFAVLKGSHTHRNWEREKGHRYQALLKHFLESGVLVAAQGHCVFAENFAFSSPSAAAAVVFGRSSNGTVEWRVRDQRITYKDWERSQLKEAAE